MARLSEKSTDPNAGPTCDGEYSTATVSSTARGEMVGKMARLRVWCRPGAEPDEARGGARGIVVIGSVPAAV